MTGAVLTFDWRIRVGFCVESARRRGAHGPQLGVHGARLAV